MSAVQSVRLSLISCMIIVESLYDSSLSMSARGGPNESYRDARWQKLWLRGGPKCSVSLAPVSRASSRTELCNGIVERLLG